MNRELIRQNSIEQIDRIETLYEHHITPGIISWYLLNLLIVVGVERYLQSQGNQHLDENSCEDGKAQLEGAELTAFERDCIKYLNSIIFKKESPYENRRQQISLVASHSV